MQVLALIFLLHNGNQCPLHSDLSFNRIRTFIHISAKKKNTKKYVKQKTTPNTTHLAGFAHELLTYE
jgi:hypothetical protein